MFRYFFVCFFLFFCFMDDVLASVSSNLHSKLYNNFDFFNTSFQNFFLISFLSFIPIFILMTTSFTRITIVFSLLRNAIGTPYSPPNQILIGLSLFLTLFIMSPVFNKIYYTAYIPYEKNRINIQKAFSLASSPIHEFMRKQTRKEEMKLFIKLAKLPSNIDIKNVPFRVLMPSFLISELKTAFQIGFTIFLPFLVIDLVVASVLMSLGMMMIPPSTISLPLKLILFVLVDGWNLLITALIKSFF